MYLAKEIIFLLTRFIDRDILFHNWYSFGSSPQLFTLPLTYQLKPVVFSICVSNSSPFSMEILLRPPEPRTE